MLPTCERNLAYAIEVDRGLESNFTRSDAQPCGTHRRCRQVFGDAVRIPGREQDAGERSEAARSVVIDRGLSPRANLNLHESSSRETGAAVQKKVSERTRPVGNANTSDDKTAATAVSIKCDLSRCAQSSRRYVIIRSALSVSLARDASPLRVVYFYVLHTCYARTRVRTDVRTDVRTCDWNAVTLRRGFPLENFTRAARRRTRECRGMSRTRRAIPRSRRASPVCEGYVFIVQFSYIARLRKRPSAAR